jgi:hypothetical protein
MWVSQALNRANMQFARGFCRAAVDNAVIVVGTVNIKANYCFLYI